MPSRHTNLKTSVYVLLLMWVMSGVEPLGALTLSGTAPTFDLATYASQRQSIELDVAGTAVEGSTLTIEVSGVAPPGPNIDDFPALGHHLAQRLVRRRTDDGVDSR